MSKGQTPNTDMPASSWVDRWLPYRARPFARLMRLDRLIGMWLLLLPGWWSLTLAGWGVPDLRLMVLFLIGAVVMRGAGCTYNDIIDRDIDARVARTASRPLASGRISVRAAWIFLGVQLALGFAILIQFNSFAMAVGAASLVLVLTYPFMKRITYWPQAWLGLTFNWGVLLGWAAARGTIDAPTLWLYAAGFFWTLGYDTIYAHQDREDDALVGVKSSALALGKRTKVFVALAYLLTTLLLVRAVLAIPLSFPMIGFLALAGIHLAWQVITLDIDDPANCLRRFRANRDFGLLVLVGFLLQTL